MCRFICDGLRRDFPDKPYNEEARTALDRHLESLEEGPFQDGPIIMKPWVSSGGRSDWNTTIALKVFIVAQVSCFLN